VRDQNRSLSVLVHCACVHTPATRTNGWSVRRLANVNQEGADRHNKNHNLCLHVRLVLILVEADHNKAEKGYSLA
jgi:hypothetical protein